MLPNVQRAKVESKSQPNGYKYANLKGCYQMYKELKLKANHNLICYYCYITWMLPNVQRAKVESKSQLVTTAAELPKRCYQMYKELKLKANHNLSMVMAYTDWDVTKCTKS